jgi:hypothetical protein
MFTVYAINGALPLNAGVFWTDSGGCGGMKAWINADSADGVVVCAGPVVAYKSCGGETPGFNLSEVLPPAAAAPAYPPDYCGDADGAHWFARYLRAYNALIPPRPGPPRPGPFDSVFAKNFPMCPFRDGGAAEWARVNPPELAKLGGALKRLGESAFAVSCYRAFKHLILGRGAEGVVYVAAPDLYSPEKAEAARNAGFTAFKARNGDAPAEGVYGYWIAETDESGN